MRRVDRATGKLDEHGSPYHLADRSAGPGNTSAIEAPFIISRAGKWYLFVSFDRCCQGVDSTYNVRVGRSDALTGPYLGREGLLSPRAAGHSSYQLTGNGKDLAIPDCSSRTRCTGWSIGQTARNLQAAYRVHFVG